MTIQFDEEKQKIKLDDLRVKAEEEFVKKVAENRGLKYFDLTKVPIDTDALSLIPEAEARDAHVAAFQLLDKQLGVGVSDPDNKKSAVSMKSLSDKGYTVSMFLVSENSLEHAHNKYKDVSMATVSRAGTFDISPEAVSSILEQVKSVEDIQRLATEVFSQKQRSQTTKVVEIVLAGALAVNASDVHMEPQQDGVRLRYRLDGVLNDILQIKSDVYNYILNRIKLISGLKLNVRTEAQDGRFSITAKGIEIEVRTSILPGSYGESIVLRILNPESISVKMESLGFEPHLLKLLEREITRPNGMLLTTGPTGSGKTTTLYAFLKKVHTPDIKIITIEDPVEYHLTGIVQTQTNAQKGYTFLAGLRAALRQDPDIIMVGEIRDNETATIAINAAATGHFVFSTLHTNNAAGTFPRLLNLGVNPKVISSSISVAMAQRLTRKLCENCKKEVSLTADESRIVEKIMSHMPIAEYKSIQRKKTWKSVGCEKCNKTGYKGRTGIYEAILMSPKIEAVVLQNPSEHEVAEAAKDQGILTMREDGIVKALQGITSFEELMRVIDLEDNA